MAFLAAFTALGSKFAGKILTTTLGWASTVLFGRVPASRQVLLLGITFGSVVWIVMLIGLIVPDVGAFSSSWSRRRPSSRPASSAS